MGAALALFSIIRKYSRLVVITIKARLDPGSQAQEHAAALSGSAEGPPLPCAVVEVLGPHMCGSVVGDDNFTLVR